jgi:hypothetical protein
MAERDINSLFTNDHAKQSSLLAFDESIKVDPGRDGKKGKKRKGKGRT